MNRGNEWPRSGQGTPLPFPPWTVGRQLVRLDASHVPETQGAPHAFHGSLRAPFHARETRSTLVAGRAAGSGRASGRCFARLDQVSRACGLGRRGYAPHCVTAGLGAGCHSATVCDLPAADLRLPPPFSGPLWADALPGATGSGALAPRHVLRPCRGSPASLGCRPATTRLPACVCRGTDCCQTVRVVASVRFLTRRPASAQGRRLPPPESVAHSWRPSPSPPSQQGLLAPCALLHPVPSGCGFGSALAVWSAGLGVDFAKGDELRKYGGKQMLPSTPSRNGLRGLRI